MEKARERLIAFQVLWLIAALLMSCLARGLEFNPIENQFLNQEEKPEDGQSYLASSLLTTNWYYIPIL